MKCTTVFTIYSLLTFNIFLSSLFKVTLKPTVTVSETSDYYCKWNNIFLDGSLKTLLN